MTLESIYYIGQTVAVIVIVATLIAILVQGYQTNKIARADLTLNVWMQTGAMQYSLVDTPEKAEYLYRAIHQPDSLTEVEKIRLPYVFAVAIGSHEAVFNLRRRNLIEAAAYDRVADNTNRYMQSAIMRKLWRRVREGGCDPQFRNLIDSIVQKVETSQSVAPIKQEPTN